MKKPVVPMLFLCILPLSACGLLWYALETYGEVVHNESGFVVCLYAAIAVAISTEIWQKHRTGHRAVTVLWIMALCLLAFVFYVGKKIPFCVVCDGVTAEALGFLTHWISPNP